MRITNKIMQNNNLTNINRNKIMQDKLSTQMSTEKKVNKPSDDPVVAIRALRLRTNVTEATQYYTKNIPDAESWLNITEGALQNLSKVITSMIGQCTKGANGDLTSSDREIILEQLKALRDEIYSTADVDYAGRYVFSGYRTDTSISFPYKQQKHYEITQQFDNNAIDSVTYVKTTSDNGGVGDVRDMDVSNYGGITVVEDDIEPVEVHRIRLAYKDLDGAVPTISHVTGRDADGNLETEELGPATIVSAYDVPNAYELAANDPDGIYFVPETGELILGDNVYNQMMSYKDQGSTSSVNEGEIRITYEKTNWEKGDLRPEHYYACSAEDAVHGTIDYNQDYLEGIDVARQEIEYDVGFNQKIRVNTTADECFDPAIGREVDDLISALEDLQSLEKIANDLGGLLENEADEGTIATLESRLKAVNKSLTLVKNKVQKMFERGITTFQGHLDATNLAITNCGTRSSKLELIENRMMNQKTTYETLQSENEDIDITEVAINLTSAELTYEAALMATGKISQTSLLNFI
ncbi:MAG: flagellar hook-associated protein FlgL [Lachnospiraceae bacterium]|nr:flagellar hook-associated protein FlgL [Lachnospiraceae bacterium]